MDKLFTYQRREIGFVELNLIPLVDVILNLLIFFLLVGSAISAGIEVQLPKANASTAFSHTANTVLILNNQTLKYQNHLMNFQQFSKELSNNPIKKLVIQANHQLPIQVLVNVIDIAKSQNVESVSIQTIPYGKLDEP